MAVPFAWQVNVAEPPSNCACGAGAPTSDAILAASPWATWARPGSGAVAVGCRVAHDWPSARLYRYLGLPVELYTPLFVISRVTGWAAHVIEQLDNNRLIRPRANYTGPAPRKYAPIAKR